MKRARILVLNQYFPPDTSATAQRIRDVVEALGRHYQVQVLCGRPSYQPESVHPYYIWRSFKENLYTVERVGSTAFHRVRWIGRLSNYLSYLGLMLLRAFTISADLVIAHTDPPVVGIVGALIARIQRKPFIYNIRDLHPDMALSSGIIRPAWWVRLWDTLHRWALRHADRVIVLGEDMRERIIQKGVHPKKVVVVRDGALTFNTNGLSPEHPTWKLIRRGFPFVICHAGNLGFYGAWDSLAESIRQFMGDSIGFVFIGDGVARRRIENRLNGSPHVWFMDYRPADELGYVLRAPDVHVVALRKGLEGLVVPSKLYPILMAGRPVLALVPEKSDVARIVQQHQCGLVVDPDDPNAIAAAIRWFRDHPDERKAMGERARKIAREFSREVQMERYLQVVREVVEGRV